MELPNAIEFDKDSTVLLDHIALKTSVEEGAAAIRDVLLRLYRNPHQKNKKLSQLTELPIPVLAAIRGECVKAGILISKSHFSPKGKQWVEDVLGFHYNEEILDTVKFEDFTLDLVPENIFRISYLNQLKNLINQRPSPRFDLDQSRATFETQIKRSLLLLKNGDIEGQSILFLGDDDATSLIISAMDVKCKINVLDIDERILVYLRKSYKSIKGTHIQTLIHDLRKPLPKDWINKFDVVFTDPPYTLPGVRLFFQRGREALNNISSKLYLSFGAKEPNLIWNLQLSCLNAGFQLWEIYRGFNKYIGNLKLGQFSNLFIFKATQAPNPIIFPSSYPGKLYTADIKNKMHAIEETNKSSQDRALGYHVVSEFYDLKSSLANDSQQLHELLLTACKSSQLNVIDSFKYSYAPYGLSIIILLVESHIGLHSWPEHNYMSIDVFICDEPSKAHKFIDILEKKLEPGKTEEIRINRGQKY